MDSSASVFMFLPDTEIRMVSSGWNFWPLNPSIVWPLSVAEQHSVPSRIPFAAVLLVIVKFCYGLRSVRQSLLVSGQIFITVGFVDVVCPLWRQVGTVVYSCFEPRQRSLSRARVPLVSWPYSTLSNLKLPQPGWPGSCIYFPQKQGNWILRSPQLTLFISLFTDPRENNVFNIFSTITCTSFAVVT
jgi:hypothetical protein